MRRALIILILLLFCAKAGVAVQERCGIENCHGADIVCGPDAPEVCTMMYGLGDFCRAYARCEMAEGECRLHKDPAYEGCANCVRKCTDSFQNNPVEAFGCEARCREDIQAAPDRAAKSNAEEKQERRPVIVLEESSRAEPLKEEWPLNRLNPTFVLYDDGLVIFKREAYGHDAYSVRLTRGEMKELREELKVSADFMELDDSYYATNEFHLPVSIIKYWQDGKPGRVMFAGRIRDNQEHRLKVPPSFLKLYDRIVTFGHPDARLWEPDMVQILIVPFTNAVGEPVPWPEDWPGLNHPTTKDMTNLFGRESYNIYLNAGQRQRLERLLSGLKVGQAFMINGRQWYVSKQKYTLPGEEEWQQ